MYESFKQIFGSEQNIISKATNQKYKHKVKNENAVYKDTRYIIIPKSELGQNWVIKLKHFICIHVGQWAQYRYHLIYQESKCVMLRRKIPVPRPMVVTVRDILNNPEIHFIRDFTLSTRPATPGPLTEITGSENHLTAHLIRHRIFPETLRASRD